MSSSAHIILNFTKRTDGDVDVMIAFEDVMIALERRLNRCMQEVRIVTSVMVKYT